MSADRVCPKCGMPTPEESEGEEPIVILFGNRKTGMCRIASRMGKAKSAAVLLEAAQQLGADVDPIEVLFGAAGAKQ